MPIDLKYGRVTLENQRNIGDDEPVIVFRAQDKLLPAVLNYYLFLCQKAGSPPHHLDGVGRVLDAVQDWQDTHPPKTPTSDGLAGKEEE
jgi:hypothetical protein